MRKSIFVILFIISAFGLFKTTEFLTLNAFRHGYESGSIVERALMKHCRNKEELKEDICVENLYGDENKVISLNTDPTFIELLKMIGVI